MRKLHVKIFSFVLCLLMLTSLATLCVGATEYEEEYVPVEWTADEENERIYANGKPYDTYYFSTDLYTDCPNAFFFMNRIEYNGSYYDLYGDSADPHVVAMILNDGYSQIFADSEGKKILDKFIEGKSCLYYLEDKKDKYKNDYYTVIDEDILAALDDGYYGFHDNFENVSVSSLKSGRILDITAHDKLEILAYEYGAIYIMPNGTYYYVCFEYLENLYFDANGHFSYRNGTVKALVLDSELRSYVDKEAEKMVYKDQSFIYEHDVYMGYIDIYGNPIYEESSSLGAIVVVFVATVFIGIIVPIPLLILGLIFGSSKKTGKAKCWYALSASAAVWLVAAIVFLILLII